MTDNYALVGSIRRSLASIRDHYDEALDPVKRAPGALVKASKEPPMPVSAHILDVRMEAFNDLQYWARFILDEVRDVNGDPLTQGPASTDTADLTSFIAIWVDWIVTNRPDDAENLAAETSKHEWALKGIVMELGSRRFTIGTCPEHGTSDLGERLPCPGNLGAVLRRDDSLLPSEIRCDADQAHTWTAGQWMQLGRRVLDVRSA